MLYHRFFCVIDPPFLFIVVVYAAQKLQNTSIPHHHHNIKSFKGPPKSVSLFSNFSRERERERE